MNFKNLLKFNLSKKDKENNIKISNLLSMEDMAKDLPILPQQIRNYLKDEKLKGFKVRNKWYVQPEDFQEFKQAYGF